MFRAGDNEFVEVGDRADETIRNSSKFTKSKNNKSENLMHVLNIEAIGEPTFLTLNAKKTFNFLRQAYIKLPTLWHFDLQSYIWIKTNISGYAIGEVLGQLSSNWVASDSSNLTKSNFDLWHLVAYFSRKMILAKMQYETHYADLLAIIEAFKT